MEIEDFSKTIHRLTPTVEYMPRVPYLETGLSLGSWQKELRVVKQPQFTFTSDQFMFFHPDRFTVFTASSDQVSVFKFSSGQVSVFKLSSDHPNLVLLCLI